MSFPIGEMQTFVVGTDTGEILAASRNGADPAVIKTDVCYKGWDLGLEATDFSWIIFKKFKSTSNFQEKRKKNEEKKFHQN